ncbi:hypothetical protein RIR_jg23656.t1 [Rhizophagus irregularis DAOM 181602=DAOM 197198]|nr:hypothetical protein RIR_jg23656.t1 [Rhizophagus irregularis DAOM 181602=DAOM 197198]
MVHRDKYFEHLGNIPYSQNSYCINSNFIKKTLWGFHRLLFLHECQSLYDIASKRRNEKIQGGRFILLISKLVLPKRAVAAIGNFKHP